MRRSKKNEKEPPRQSYRTSIPMSSQIFEDADPGVISEGESIDDFRVSNKSVLRFLKYTYFFLISVSKPSIDVTSYTLNLN